MEIDVLYVDAIPPVPDKLYTIPPPGEGITTDDIVVCFTECLLPRSRELFSEEKNVEF